MNTATARAIWAMVMDILESDCPVAYEALKINGDEGRYNLERRLITAIMIVANE